MVCCVNETASGTATLNPLETDLAAINFFFLTKAGVENLKSPFIFLSPDASVFDKNRCSVGLQEVICVSCRLPPGGRDSGRNAPHPLRGDGVLHQALNRGGHQHDAADPGLTGGEGLVHTGLQPHRLRHQVRLNSFRQDSRYFFILIF